MRIQSPLSSLCETLEQVKEAAARYDSVLRKNEAATRAALIDPVLRGLGWDIANTFMVEVEKRNRDAVADYALKDANGGVVVLVEAKALGTKLTDQLALTLVHYAFQFEARRLFLTDGLIWRYYCDFTPGNVKPERTLDLANDSVVDLAAYLVERLDAVMFWPEADSVDELSQKVTQLENEVATLKGLMAGLSAPKQEQPGQGQKAISPTPASSTAAMPSNLANLQFVDLAKMQDARGKKPGALRLPDGTTMQVSKWSEVLRECCKWALNAYPAMPVPLPDQAGRTVELLSLKQPPVGINFVVEQHKDKTIYIYTNYDANHSVGNARHVLEQVPAAQKSVAAAVAIEKA